MENTDESRWENNLWKLTSRDRYGRCVKRYFAWCSEVGKDCKDPFVVEAYITDAHERFLTNPGAQNSLCIGDVRFYHKLPISEHQAK